MSLNLFNKQPYVLVCMHAHIHVYTSYIHTWGYTMSVQIHEVACIVLLHFLTSSSYETGVVFPSSYCSSSPHCLILTLLPHPAGHSDHVRIINSEWRADHPGMCLVSSKLQKDHLKKVAFQPRGSVEIKLLLKVYSTNQCKIRFSVITVLWLTLAFVFYLRFVPYSFFWRV